MLTLGDIRAGARFVWGLRPLLRRPLDTGQAKAALDRRLASRAERFLALVKRAVYGHPASSYRALLGLARCEYGDLERLVRREGVEGALDQLLRHGIYLTVEEFKGRRPVRRGGVEVEVKQAGLRNPGSTAHIEGTTSGSRGAPAPVAIDITYVRAWAQNLRLQLEIRGGLDWARAYWAPASTTSIAWLVCYAAAGLPQARWFTPIDPQSLELPALYRASARLLPWAGLVAGARLPRAEHAPLAEPTSILRWMTAVLRAGGTPCLVGYASALVQLCQAARDSGVELAGARVQAVGEPLTVSRLHALRRAGVEASVSYGSADAGPMAYSCLSPEAPDDVHFYDDLLAVIQPELGHIAGMRSHSLLVSTLCESAPLVLLNVSLGDEAIRTGRRCGCPLQQLGWTTHLHTIRSYEKLTAGGMTFLDADLVRVLEETLPARFGGSPIDYQLVEQEKAGGAAGLRLVVHPRVGPLDAAALVSAFLDALGARSNAERIMGLAWREEGVLTVERRPPRATPSGKILHLHVESPIHSARPPMDGVDRDLGRTQG
jgi:hypothetical protein